MDLVTMADVRAHGVCVAGAREFCKRYNLDWREFVRHGFPCETLLATGDGLAAQVVETVRARERGQE